MRFRDAWALVAVAGCSIRLDEGDWARWWLDRMVDIPAGTFTMGCTDGQEGDCDSDEDAHEVEITRNFKMMATEVAQGSYEDVVGDNPSDFSGCGADCPVESVSWYEAVAFANLLSERADLDQCYTIDDDEVSWPSGLDCEGWRLPTEAEWEYAARAGTDLKYAGSDDVDEVAWTNDIETHPVAGLDPNAWGLYDMSGNVWEWVWDEYDDYPDGSATDPTGAETDVVGASRVIRGGGWFGDPRGARVANRGRGAPGDRDGNLGLRLVRSVQTGSNP